VHRNVGAAQHDLPLGTEPSATQHVLVDGEAVSVQGGALGVSEGGSVEVQLAANVSAEQVDFAADLSVIQFEVALGSKSPSGKTRDMAAGEPQRVNGRLRQGDRLVEEAAPHQHRPG
jgi:hypothetical protein